MPPNNEAAWLISNHGRPLEIKPAPYTPPGPNEIVIRNHAVAINPVDWGKQRFGDAVMGHVKYPFILGFDTAGEVVEIGAKVHRFRVGDRVIGCATGLNPDVNRSAEGAFQHYVVLQEHLTAALPEHISFENGCVVPVGVCVAAFGLFHEDLLNLDMPSVSARPKTGPDGSERAVIVTGGASSVGSAAVQLAVAAGYEVYSTCSAKNFEYVCGLGAKRVFDYRDPGWVADMTEALREKEVMGAYVVGKGGVEGCTKILQQLSEEGRDVQKNIAYAGFHVPAEQIKTWSGTARFTASTLWWVARTTISSYMTGVKAKFVDTSGLSKPDCVAARVFAEFLPVALATKQFVPAPEALVVGRGLEKIQEAMDMQAKGVSARKVVVSL